MTSPQISEDILTEIFLYLDLRDLSSVSQVCSQWHDVLLDEDSCIWESQFLRNVPLKAQKSKVMESFSSYKAKLIAYLHGWNPSDCSKNIYILDDGFTYHRRAVAQSTDAARGRRGFRSGRHCWEVWWEKSLGSHAVIGVALKQARMEQQGYLSLIGNNAYSWGWNVVDNTLYHKGRVGKFPRFAIPKIEVILICCGVANLINLMQFGLLIHLA